MIRNSIYVVGMRIEKCISVEAASGSWDCETQPCNDEKYILFCVAELDHKQREKFTITLSNEGGWCGSGYCAATWGDMEIKEVEKFGPLTHRPKRGMPIQIENAYYKIYEGACFEKFANKEEYKNEERYSWCSYCYDAEVVNNVFAYSPDGNDSYYPSGYALVNMDLFAPYERGFQKRPVWIFAGKSNTGKSTLAYYLDSTYKVFETDELEDGELPEFIWADIIVVGNKHELKVSDILPHLPEGTEAVIVNFSRGENE